MNDSCASFQLLDRLILVESGSPGFIADLRRCFEEEAAQPSQAAGSADLKVRVAVFAEAGKAQPRVEVTSTPEKALRMRTAFTASAGWSVARELVQWVVDSASSYYVFHSGSVARGGRGILMPGATHSGKSTLTVALAQRGFDILSDEVGAIRVEGGMQIGFGRALSVRSEVVGELGIEEPSESGCFADGAYILRAGALGLSRASSARTALVVLPTYQGRAPTELRALRPAAAVMALYQASCSQPRWKLAGLDFVIDLATRVPCFELTYSDMHEAARAIDGTFRDVCAREIPLELGRARVLEQGEPSP